MNFVHIYLISYKLLSRRRQHKNVAKLHFYDALRLFQFLWVLILFFNIAYFNI
jgi:hypothetical protein